MTRALVLMKALPPTKGHEALLRFATGFAASGVVMIDTAPGEPFVDERVDWVKKQLNAPMFAWRVHHIITGDQDPDSDGFWERWKKRFDSNGLFDVVIGSEPYCEKVADVIDARYIPYDPDRELFDSHATEVRGEPLTKFALVANDFQPWLRTTVTIWGAESTGKTTLSRQLADVLDGHWTFEWARPFLETVGPEITRRKMFDIWHGQWAVEENAKRLTDKPFIVRDTDLYSTIGYWEQPHWAKELNSVPAGLIGSAASHRADLYIICPSNIDFEADPIRYGGDRRESPDDFWLAIAKKYELPYVMLTSLGREARLIEAAQAAAKAAYEKTKSIRFSRELVS